MEKSFEASAGVGIVARENHRHLALRWQLLQSLREHLRPFGLGVDPLDVVNQQRPRPVHRFTLCLAQELIELVPIVEIRDVHRDARATYMRQKRLHAPRLAATGRAADDDEGFALLDGVAKAAPRLAVAQLHEVCGQPHATAQRQRRDDRRRS